MDTSNPVIPNDRRSIKELLESSVKRRRQDLAYLGDVASAAQRVLLPVTHDRLQRIEVQSLCTQFRKNIPVVAQEKDEPIPASLVKLFEAMHVSGVLGTDGLPIHPPAVNNVRGKVSVRRRMGGTPSAPLGLSSFTEILGDRILDTTHVYTHGTWKGFMERISQQTGRKTISILEMERVAQQNPKLESKALFSSLDALIPRRRSEAKWPLLERDLDESLSLIKITGKSSAGAPYHTNKRDCMDDILSVGLPMVVNAIKEDKLMQLWEQNPEFFLCELKNKLDRYDKNKLDTKTRPYLSIPAHWSLLFSVLAQRFQETLHTFDQCAASTNAYGFTAAKGGLMRMYDWMKTAGYYGKFCCYGDDTCLVVKSRKDDKVYRVDPDFSQMDGSVAEGDVSLVIDWICDHFRREEGSFSDFWSTVAVVWKQMASHPMFVLDGTSVYSKKTNDGLFSGVPGTTLFDTVKSIMSWSRFLETCRTKGWDPLDEKIATRFMLKNAGLVIKPGTWSPQAVPELRAGVLITDHKFLGVQMLVEEYAGELIIVPTIPEQEAVNMLLVQKDDPFDKKNSTTIKARTLYDRMRGLYMTFGFSIPLVESAIHNCVNDLDPVSVLMSTITPGGESPDSLILDGFTFPDSSGFPSRDFCLKLFSDSGVGEQEESWISLFPTIKPLVEEWKKADRYVEVVSQVVKTDVSTQMELEEGETSYEVETKHIFSLIEKSFQDVRQQVEDLMQQTQFQILDTIATGNRKKTIRVPNFEKPPNEFSKYVNVKGEEPIKRAPALGAHIRKFVEEEGVTEVKSVCKKFKIAPEKLDQECVNFGIFKTGAEGDDILAVSPIATPTKTDQSRLVTLMKEKTSLITPGLEARQAAAAKAPASSPPVEYVETGPYTPWINEDFFNGLGPYPPFKDAAHALKTFPVFVNSHNFLYTCRFTNQPVDMKKNPPNGVTLEVCETMDSPWVIVGKARALNCKLAKIALLTYIYRQRDHPVTSDPFTALVVKSARREASTSVRAPVSTPPPAVVDWAGDIEKENRDSRRALFREVLPASSAEVRARVALLRPEYTGVPLGVWQIDPLNMPQEDIITDDENDHFLSEKLAGAIRHLAKQDLYAFKLLSDLSAFYKYCYRQAGDRVPPANQEAQIIGLLRIHGPHYIEKYAPTQSNRSKLSERQRVLQNQRTLKKRKARKSSSSEQM